MTNRYYCHVGYIVNKTVAHAISNLVGSWKIMEQSNKCSDSVDGSDQAQKQGFPRECYDETGVSSWEEKDIHHGKYILRREKKRVQIVQSLSFQLCVADELICKR